MLGKLFKYQMKSVSKILLIIHAAVLVFGLLLGIAAPTLSFSSETTASTGMPVYEMIFILAAILFVFMLSGVVYTVYILLAIRFYRNMFTDESYLTHTLPIKSGTLLFSHILTFSVWYMISVIVLFLSIALLVIGAGGGPEALALIRGIPEFYNTNMLVVIFCVLQFFIVSAVSCATMVYAAICIGNLFAPRKVLASIVTYIIFYAIVQIVTFIVMMLLPSMRSMMFMQTTNLYPPNALLSTLIWTEVETIIFSAIFWITSHIILKKHLNIE